MCRVKTLVLIESLDEISQIGIQGGTNATAGMAAEIENDHLAAHMIPLEGILPKELPHIVCTIGLLL